MSVRRLFKTSRYNVLARMNRLVLNGMYKPPVWYHAVRRVPPIVQLEAEHPGVITFPEDRLYPSLYERLPSLQDEALLVTSLNQPTVGSQIARRWLAEIERTENRNEDAAWEKVMADPEVQGWLSAYRKRVEEAAEHPITAGNVRRHVEHKLQAMSLMRKLAASTPTDERKAEVASGLDVLATAQRLSGIPLQEDVGSMERGELRQSGREWVVPDMSDVHRLRFVVAPPNDALNVAYMQKTDSAPKQRSRPLGDNTADDNTLHWAMSKAVVQEGATIRDWIAYALRIQVLVLRRRQLARWVPYTNCIDRTLWRQACVILRCRRVETLEGEEIDQKRATMQTSEHTMDGIRNQLPLVYHNLQPPLSLDDQKKHALLLSFIDDALARHTFSEDELAQRAPPPPITAQRAPPPPITEGKSRTMRAGQSA